jgi:hypothetical protein
MARRAGIGGGNFEFTKKSLALLKPEKPLLIFFRRHTRPGRLSQGLVETGADGVRRLLVPILLNGGFGYGNLRLHSPLAVDDRF